MAQKDIALGWGDLPRRLEKWRCPTCAVESPVENWAIVWGEVNGVKCDGRKCPGDGCTFAAYQHHESRLMVPSNGQ